MSKSIIIQVSVPDQATAKTLAEHLIREKLVACVQIIPAMESMYMWEGKLETESESLLVLKTFDTHFKKIEKVIIEKHPYEVPEILAIRSSNISNTYLAWMQSVTS